MSRKKIGIITSLVGLTVVLVSIFAFHIIEHFQIAITNEKYGGTKSSDIIWLQIDDNWASEENVTEWKLKGYDIVNNETAKNIV
ncbi:MAG: hypothetical protein KGI08_09415, partial [Thaumarchaeota archaeon]|nr:hypothetical protein [Nitrososphaerota archaeon]